MVAVSTLCYFELVPVLTILAMAILLARAVYGLMLFRPENTAKEISILEDVYGVFTLIAVVTGFILAP